MKYQFKILSANYLEQYLKEQPYTLSKHFKKLREADLSVSAFNFIVASSVFSSNIEGNPIDIDTYWRFTEMGINLKTKPYKEIKDLVKAYEFAQKHKLTYENVLKTHKYLTKTLLKERPDYSGKIRNRAVCIEKSVTREVIYQATEHELVDAELIKMFADIDQLLKQELSIDEVFYFASMVHLRFAQIHSFVDGNGRTARLLEKWFIAEKLGNTAWYIQSERNYHKKITAYYRNIHLGKDYDHLNYDVCMPFLLMLPSAIKLKS